MTTAAQLESRFDRSWPAAAWRDVTVLLAVSGGADSVALLRLVHAMKTGGQGRLVVAHLNHGVRGDASEADEAFVRQLCRQLDVALCVERADPAELTRAGGDGLEAAARSARYEFLTRAAEQSGARYVATAHTADDQAETIMHRIVRGTGLVGLAGIPSARVLSPAVTLVRPILDFRRTEVLDYLRAIGQTFREDASNADVRWTRNRIRNELLPNLQRDYHRGAVDALLRLGRLAGEAQQVIDDCVDAASQRAVVSDDNDAIVFDVTQLAQLRPYLLREMLLRAWRHRGWPLQAMGLPQWEQLAAVATSDDAADDRPVKQVFPGGVAAENDGTRFALRRPDD